MRLLIAISSCSKFEQNGWNNALRDTWLVDANTHKVDYKFFSGEGSQELPDTVIVPVNDTYAGLIDKTFEKYKWTLENGYDLLFHCYHDTYACVERLLSCGADRTDYMGDFFHTDPRQPWPHASYGNHCQSGAGAFLSRRAVEKVVQDFPATKAQNPGIWEEDLWTGKIIRDYPELTITDTRYMPCNLSADDIGPRRGNQIISCHLSTIYPKGYKWDGQGREAEWKYRPEYMYKLHKEWLEPCV